MSQASSHKVFLNDHSVDNKSSLIQLQIQTDPITNADWSN